MSDLRLSMCVHDLNGEAVLQRNASESLNSASVGKVFLLSRVAERLERGDVSHSVMLDRRSVPRVGGSGLWQHLDIDTLPIMDVARLVASVSDNWATNVLINHLGDVLDDPNDDFGMFDFIRDERGPEHPTRFSAGSAWQWISLLRNLSGRAGDGSWAANETLRWMGLSMDTSMALAPLHVDSLSHANDQTSTFIVANKTGTDAGVRADVGFVRRRHPHAGVDATFAYAVVANWTPVPGQHDDEVAAVLDTMAEVGRFIAAQ